jgi:alpha-beta hydrolase superfamily lysophospholipase
MNPLGDIEVETGVKISCYGDIHSSPRAVMVWVHGMGEHAGRYHGLSSFFYKKGFSFFAFDLRGHGRSSGRRGHADRMSQLTRDLNQVLEKVFSETPEGVPVWLAGHSMGGNLVANYILEYGNAGLSGALLSAPYFKLSFQPPFWKKMLAALADHIAPSLVQPTGLNVLALARDYEVVREYTKDPYVHDKISVAMYRLLYNGGRNIISQKHEWPSQFPTWIFHGNEDAITCAKTSEMWASQMAGSVYVSVPMGFHEWFRDNGNMRFFEEWIHQF